MSIAFIIIPMILTFLILVMGLVAMVAGDKINKKYSNRLMQARVYMQIITLIMLFLYSTS